MSKLKKESFWVGCDDYFSNINAFIEKRKKEGFEVRVIDVKTINDHYNIIYQETPINYKLTLYFFESISEYNDKLKNNEFNRKELLTIVHKGGYYEFVFKEYF